MPSTVAALGVAAYSNTTTQSVEITKTVEETHLVEKDGTYGQGTAYDPTFEVQVSGRGDLPSLTLGGSTSITGVSGGVSIITNISQTEKNEDYQDWSFTMRNWPGAS
jgi:hypothetical protein